MQALHVQKAGAGLAQLLAQFQEQAVRSGLEPALVALVCLRASQLSGSIAYLGLHTAAALTAGETAPRLTALPHWDHSGMFTDRERAALEWTEAVTRVALSYVARDLWQRLAPQLPPEEIVDLTLLAAQSRVPDELWPRLTPQLSQRQIDDITRLVAVVNICIPFDTQT